MERKIEPYNKNVFERIERSILANSYPFWKANSEELWDFTNYLHKGGLEKIPKGNIEEIRDFFVQQGDSYRRGFFMDMYNPLRRLKNLQAYLVAKDLGSKENSTKVNFLESFFNFGFIK